MKRKREPAPILGWEHAQEGAIRAAGRKQRLRWQYSHGRKKAYRWSWQAIIVCAKFNRKLLRGELQANRPWEVYPCRLGSYWKDDSPGRVHWHVGRPRLWRPAVGGPILSSFLYAVRGISKPRSKQAQ